MTARTPPRRRPTQADVARLAAVSQPVVSYVLSDTAGAPVAPETRQRVLDAIATLGYVPHHAARSLRQRRTFTIASAIPDITNPYYPAFERGIQDVAEREHYDLITYNTDGSPEKERKFLRSALAGRVDGIIVRFFHAPLTECLHLVEAGIAVVALTSEPPPAGTVPIDTTAINGAAAAEAAVGFLIARGHQRIAMLAGRAETRAWQRRSLGYREALRKHRIPFDSALVRACEFTEAGGYEGTCELLCLAARPSAIFAADDLIAFGAMAALREANLRVPEDMALIGFDDVPAARLVCPPLTTIAQHPERLGAQAAELLLERLGGGGPPHGRHVELPFDLVVRQSV